MPHGKRPRAHRVSEGCFALVIRGFLESDKFKKYSPSIQDNWGRQLRLAETVLGPLSIYSLRPGLVQAFFDGINDRPAKQAAALRALRQVEKWAIRRELIPYPFTMGVEIGESRGGHVPWTDEQVAIGEAHARGGFDRVITLASNTGQRGSDLVKMRWSDLETMVNGRVGINVVQQKTGLKLWIPCTMPLLKALATWERTSEFILMRPCGIPWTRHRLSNHWVIERRKNPKLKPIRDAGLVMHGLRATAVVRLSRAGATTRQISDMVGMSEPMVAHYCRYSSQRENAMAALQHLERSKNPPPSH